MSIEQEILEQLLKSKKIIGELNEVIYDKDGTILSGRHRAKVGWKKGRTLDTQVVADQLKLPRDLVRELFVIHFNVQRRPSKEETQTRLVHMAELIVKNGTPKEEVAAKLTQYVPYSEQYVRELLPDEYKQIEHRPKTEPKLVSVPEPSVELDIGESVHVEEETPDATMKDLDKIPETRVQVDIEHREPKTKEETLDTAVSRILEQVKLLKSMTKTAKFEFVKKGESCPICGRVRDA